MALVAANGTEVTASRLVRYFDGAIVESQSDITDNTVKRLAWKGDMAETDFEYIRNNMSSTLEVLDLSATTLTELPTRALAFYSSMGLSDNKTLKEVILPDGLTTIGNSAFAMCKALYKLNIPSTVTTLGRWILEGAGLTSFVIPDGATLSESTFYGSSIVEIRIPTTMTEIPAYCFTECKNLERIFLHDDISNIGKEAFFNCYALKSFTAPRSLTVLSDALFYNCESLSRVTLHDGITEFGTECFTFCTSLRELITNKDDENDSYLAWPKALQTMGETVFANSGLVTEVRLADFEHLRAEWGELAGLKFQQQFERLARQYGGEHQIAPAQRVADFVAGRASGSLPRTSYIPGVVPSRLDKWMPGFIASSLRAGIATFGRRMRGFLTNEALVVGVESRTSTPVRIPRDAQTLMHPEVAGLFPAGEGAGYAGGIISAALDGERIADAVVNYLKK